VGVCSFGAMQIVGHLKGVRANQSLKLTAEAQVVSRCAQDNELVIAARRQCWTALRIVRKYSYQRRSLAPVR
jgi:hypothetical protein